MLVAVDAAQSSLPHLNAGWKASSYPLQSSLNIQTRHFAPTPMTTSCLILPLPKCFGSCFKAALIICIKAMDNERYS